MRGKKEGELRIKEYRLKKYWSQTTLGKEAGFSENSICNYETGLRSPKISDLRKIAKALKCKVTDLIIND